MLAPIAADEMQWDLAAAVAEARRVGGEAVALDVIRRYMATDGWRLRPGADRVVEVGFSQALATEGRG